MGNVKPEIALDLDGPGGNVFSIFATCARAAKRAGWTRKMIDDFQTEAMQYSYSHVLDIVFEYFDVVKTQVVSMSIDRDDI